MTVSINKRRIELFTRDNATDAKAIDGTFIINVLSTSSDGFRYEIISIPTYEKRYSHTEIDPRILDSYLKYSDRSGFLAYLQDRPAGLLLLSKAGTERL